MINIMMYKNSQVRGPRIAELYQRRREILIEDQNQEIFILEQGWMVFKEMDK